VGVWIRIRIRIRVGQHRGRAALNPLLIAQISITAGCGGHVRCCCAAGERVHNEVLLPCLKVLLLHWYRKSGPRTEQHVDG
jgi:hypothetical protein